MKNLLFIAKKSSDIHQEKSFIQFENLLSNAKPYYLTIKRVIQRETCHQMQNVLFDVKTCYPTQKRVIQCKYMFIKSEKHGKNVNQL